MMSITAIEKQLKPLHVIKWMSIVKGQAKASIDILGPTTSTNNWTFRPALFVYIHEHFPQINLWNCCCCCSFYHLLSFKYVYLWTTCKSAITIDLLPQIESWDHHGAYCGPVRCSQPPQLPSWSVFTAVSSGELHVLVTLQFQREKDMVGRRDRNRASQCQSKLS